jgi:diadenosine tetraphosphatase ApaH/serine/threonine PP2A family protein phosphatase
MVVAGDMVGFGPDPDGVVDLLIQRGAEMIRGNHEGDYVAIYDTPAMPPEWKSSIRYATGKWIMERLGATRRAFLSQLPDAIRLDDRTLVVHGSPRSARDAVRATTPVADLEAMFADSQARLVFMGHTHQPVIRDLPSRRLVNVGSAGMPLDGDPRPSYAILDPSAAHGNDTPDVLLHRVAYDLDAAVAAFENGLAEADPYLSAIIRLEMRTSGSYLGRWRQFSRVVPDEELPAALARFLASST